MNPKHAFSLSSLLHYTWRNVAWDIKLCIHFAIIIARFILEAPNNDDDFFMFPCTQPWMLAQLISLGNFAHYLFFFRPLNFIQHYASKYHMMPTHLFHGISIERFLQEGERKRGREKINIVYYIYIFLKASRCIPNDSLLHFIYACNGAAHFSYTFCWCASYINLSLSLSVFLSFSLSHTLSLSLPQSIVLERNL